jgi:WD40 repeat protein
MKRTFLAALTLTLAASSCAQIDHPTNTQLAQELADRSKNGVALAKFSEADNTLEVRSFDGHVEKVPLEINGELRMATHGRMAVLDLDPTIRHKMAEAALRGDRALYLELFARLSGNIVLLSNTGKIERRSAVRVNASVMAVSRDGEKLAFIGVPQGISETEFGVYVGDFDSKRLVRVFAFGSDDPRQPLGAAGRATLDWAPTGKKLLFSYRGKITTFDVDGGSSLKIADGGSARWSPSGDQISFVGPKYEAMLLDLPTGKIAAIDPGFEIDSTMEWSPDGSYLLIPEGEGTHVPYGCHWVYRLSDKAFFPECDYHLINPLPFWIKIEHSDDMPGK